MSEPLTVTLAAWATPATASVTAAVASNFVMFAFSIGQLGGIVGGVGQAIGAGIEELLARPLVQAVGNFQPGEGPRLLETGAGRFGTLICYEVIFPDLVRRLAAAGAEFLVNITNDAWYERSAASAQQFAHLAFRAVENRRPIARAANTGISGFVDASGLDYRLHAMGTVLEGEWDEVFAAVRRCHEALHAMGVQRVSSSIRVGSRTDKPQTIELANKLGIAIVGC